jgi:hypothetical protein
VSACFVVVGQKQKQQQKRSAPDAIRRLMAWWAVLLDRVRVWVWVLRDGGMVDQRVGQGRSQT